MILSKVSIFFTTLAVATLSAKSAEVISSDVMVERDTRMLKKKGKKGKKGGSASQVYTKSKKKGKKSISTASPTGLCEQHALLVIASQIDFENRNYAGYREIFENDALLSTVPEIFSTLDMAVSLNNDVQSIFFGDDTGCDFNDSLELYNGLPLGKDFQENTRRLSGRELQLGLEEIVGLGQSSIGDLLLSRGFYDNLNKLYPPAMDKLDQIACGYHRTAQGVVAIIAALSEGSVDLTIYMEDTGVEVTKFLEDAHLFTDHLDATPTVFDYATCDPLTASPTGICEQNAFPFIAYQIDFEITNYAGFRETFDNDALLSTVPEVYITLDMAVSLNNDVQSIFFGDDTGCDYNDALELYNTLPLGRNLQENTRQRGRELQLGEEEIVALGQSAIFDLSLSCVFYDNLNKLYPPAMGKLDQIACGYYAAGQGVVAIISALSEGTVDLTIYMEDTLGEILKIWEEDFFFPDVIGAAPTAFDNTPCNL